MAANSEGARATFVIERTYATSLDKAWALWTTKSGLESWWGPEGFEVTVTALDLRPGGELLYVMTAVGPEQVAFMQQAGMALSTQCRVTYIEVTPTTRLAYKTRADFVPGVPPYDVATVVQLQAVGDEVRIVMSFDAMHDAVWTERARAGHESQMRKLDRLLAQPGHMRV